MRQDKRGRRMESGVPSHMRLRFRRNLRDSRRHDQAVPTRRDTAWMPMPVHLTRIDRWCRRQLSTLRCSMAFLVPSAMSVDSDSSAADSRLLVLVTIPAPNVPKTKPPTEHPVGGAFILNV